jgi:hypothetical protein
VREDPVIIASARTRPALFDLGTTVAKHVKMAGSQD